MAELADAPDLGSGTSGVQVRPLLPAPRRRKLCTLAAAYFKPPTRSLRCGSFSPQNFAAQTFVGAPAALRAAYRLCSIQKARPVGRAFLISLRHSISAQEPPLTRRLASKRACGRSPSPHGVLPVQTSAGAPAARRAANTQAVHRLRRLILSHRRARSATAPSPHKILLAQAFVGNLSARSALASPAMEYRDYQRNHERNCYLHCFSSYRSFVFILSSSSFSCFSD